MNKQSDIYNRYVEEFKKTHKEVSLDEIQRPDLTGAKVLKYTVEIYNPSNQVEVKQLQNGSVVSVSYRWGSPYRYFAGDYQEWADNQPMAFNQYFEY